ncbi:MAG: DUF6471 domain-containing protein [Dongiaceae bacterium]
MASTGRSRGLIKAEPKKRNLSHEDLAEELAAIGVKDSKRNISKRASSGCFDAIFFVQRIVVVGCHRIHLTDA